VCIPLVIFMYMYHDARFRECKKMLVSYCLVSFSYLAIGVKAVLFFIKIGYPLVFQYTYIKKRSRITVYTKLFLCVYRMPSYFFSLHTLTTSSAVLEG
jgi:hypothetical protein